MTDNNLELKNAVKKQENKVSATQQTQMLLKKMESQIKMALPEHISSERFIRIALSALSNNPQLARCESMSFISAVMQSAQLGLEPNTPLQQAHLIPFKNKVTFIIGYKGLQALAWRTGKYTFIGSRAVREKDEFKIAYGKNMELVHVPPVKGDRGEVIGYYALYVLTNGGWGFEYLTKDEAREHGRKFSKSFNNGPWQTSFDAMAKKTALIKALQNAPLSAEVQTAMVADEKIIESKDENDLLDVEYTIIPDDIDEETGEILS